MLRIKFEKLLDRLMEQERIPINECEEEATKSSSCNLEVVIDLKLELLKRLDVIIHVVCELKCDVQLPSGQGPCSSKYDMQ